MPELSKRMIRDMQLAGLVEGTRREDLRGVRQLAAFYMVSPEQLSERKVEDYVLHVRDDLGVAKGDVRPRCSTGSSSSTSIRSATTGLCSRKKVRKPRRERLPDVRGDEDCRRLIATLEKPVYRGCFTLIYACGLRITEAVTLPVSAVDRTPQSGYPAALTAGRAGTIVRMKAPRFSIRYPAGVEIVW